MTMPSALQCEADEEALQQSMLEMAYSIQIHTMLKLLTEHIRRPLKCCTLQAVLRFLKCTPYIRSDRSI